jgi:hypothetical protein
VFLVLFCLRGVWDKGHSKAFKGWFKGVSECAMHLVELWRLDALYPFSLLLLLLL